MALTDESNNGMIMPVAPMYGGGYGNGGLGGLGGDWGWIILLLLVSGGGWGFGGGFGGGFGNMMLGYDFPWLMTGQQNINTNTNNGFRDAMINDNITSVRDGISALSTQLCGCCGDMQMAIANGFAGVEQGANARQIANMQQLFGNQTAMLQGFNGVQSQIAQTGSDNRFGIADLKYTVATENCADRYEAAQNTRDIIEASNRNSQAIIDKLCQLELDGVKGQLAQAQRENVSLQNQLNMANFDKSQVAQTADLRQSDAVTANQLIQELRSCPIPSMPVYGQTPIFTCNNSGCGCGCGNNF